MIYILLLFAILGTHLYNGDFYNACRYSQIPESPGNWAIDESIGRICSKTGSGLFECPTDRYCGNPEDFDLSIDHENITTRPYMYYGIHKFDNIFESLLVVFQLITSEAWSSYMYNLMDVDLSFFAGLYTITLVMFGSFFLMNLILAVIIQAFITITKSELEEQVRQLGEEEEA